MWRTSRPVISEADWLIDQSCVSASMGTRDSFIESSFLVHSRAAAIVGQLAAYTCAPNAQTGRSDPPLGSSSPLDCSQHICLFSGG